MTFFVHGPVLFTLRIEFSSKIREISLKCLPLKSVQFFSDAM
jgi:hypothetical protein